MQRSFEAGQLLERVRAQGRHGLATGALQPIATEPCVVEDAGIPFLVRTLVGQKRKMAAGARQRATRTNPFSPWDDDLFVADLSPSHVCLLNKFNVVDDHVLVVTRAFEPQQSRLTLLDLEATWRVLAEIDGLAYYNSGPVAGASQPHKHLQLVPLPLSPAGAPQDRATPVDPTEHGRPRLPFFHAWRPVTLAPESAPIEAAQALERSYAALRREVGLRSDDAPYNFLMTRRWMMLVPRRAPTHRGVIVNGIGFAGTLLVRSADEMASLRRTGPLAVLDGVAGPM